MVHAMTSDRRGHAIVCPACDTANVYERSGNGNATEHPDRPYYCLSCRTAVQYVIERPKKKFAHTKQDRLPGVTEPRRLLSTELQAMNPEDIDLNPIGVRNGQP